MKRNVVYFVLLALLAGCSGVQNLVQGDKIKYKSEGTRLPPLEVPPDLTAPSRDDTYAVPDVATRGTATLSAYNAERGAAANVGSKDILPNVANVHIERAGSERWLVVPESPQKVWPVVKEFWQGMGFLIKTENPQTGVMETDWAENRAKLPQGPIRSVLGKVFDSVYSTGELDKFRTRLERGSKPNTTEIYISHRGMEEVYDSADKEHTVWQPRAPDPELEAVFLRRLMVRFGVEDARARAELAGVDEKVERAKLVHAADGQESLQMTDSFDRAWRRVGLALDRVGFTVEDRDRSKGFYYVRYVDPQSDLQREDKGFLSSLAFWRSAKSNIKPEQYRILVKEAGTLTEVQVLNKNGQQEKSDTGKRILALLHEQLK